MNKMPKTDFKFHTEFRVRWMECDAQGIVFNGAYLGYLELSTAEYCATWALASTTCRVPAFSTWRW